MIRLPPSSTRTEPRLPYTSLFRSEHRAGEDAGDQHQRDRRTPGAPGDPLRADTDDADQGDFDEQGVDREHRIKPMARQGKCQSKKETARSPCGERAALSFSFDARSELAAQRHAISRSEEHTSELQSLMRISYAAFCLKKTQT